MFNWEELGKIDSSLLRTMRHIAFGRYTPSYDGAYFDDKKKAYGDGEYYIHELDEQYPMMDVVPRDYEEWPSEKWNFQDRFPLKSVKTMRVENLEKSHIEIPTGDEASQELKISNQELKELFASIKGLGAKKIEKVFEIFSDEAIVDVLEQQPSALTCIKGIKDKTVSKIVAAWVQFKEDRVR